MKIYRLIDSQIDSCKNIHIHSIKSLSLSSTLNLSSWPHLCSLWFLFLFHLFALNQLVLFIMQMTSLLQKRFLKWFIIIKSHSGTTSFRDVNVRFVEEATCVAACLFVSSHSLSLLCQPLYLFPSSLFRLKGFSWITHLNTFHLNYVEASTLINLTFSNCLKW